MYRMCSVSDKAFTLIKNLHRHAKSHESPTKIVCSISSEIFTRRDNLNRHKKEKHLQSRNGHKRSYHKENSNEAANAKKARLLLVHSPGFTEISSSANRRVVWYYVKNFKNIQNYIEFFNSIKSELVVLLKSLASKHPIKFNLKLEAMYNIPNRTVHLRPQPDQFFSETGVREIVEEGIIKLMAEQDEYSSKGSGYTLQCIDGLLLGVYKYTPMSASTYIPLSDFIEKKKAVINPQNSDQQCFK
ncbi:hypothetical protein AGLY_011491 [Aphis glycines]|uniref:C2H2-type domain-containing protein n=1 Tax=Aphis glycines TaxID=307491 RepID=A0A6G0TD05_APHGL|nr:hypothetical protein AGLY_011491 [Aphis glycines]